MTNRYTNVPKSDNKPENVVIIRGGGDLASGTIHRLYRCGYRLLVLECEKPTAIRRMVSFCEAVYDGQSSVEGVLCRKVDSVEECEAVWKAGEIPLMADTEGTVLKKYRPAALIDAILAKKNLGTTREMADLTVGLGPGFVAGKDVDYVVETMRGHNLARIITKGAAYLPVSSSYSAAITYLSLSRSSFTLTASPPLANGSSDSPAIWVVVVMITLFPLSISSSVRR